jgi:hypothetical protein
MTDRPSRTQLEKWLEQYRDIYNDSYQELLESYSPEQQKIVHKMNQAKSQANLCKARLERSWNYGRSYKYPVDPIEFFGGTKTDE